MQRGPEREHEPGGFGEPPLGDAEPEVEAMTGPDDQAPSESRATLEGEPIPLTPPETPRPSQLDPEHAVVRPDKRIGFGPDDLPARAIDAARWLGHHRPHWPRFKRAGTPDRKPQEPRKSE